MDPHMHMGLITQSFLVTHVLSLFTTDSHEDLGGLVVDMLVLRWKCPWLEPHKRHCVVSLSKAFHLRNTGPF